VLLFDPGIDVHAELLRGLESALAGEPLWSDLVITACPDGNEQEPACLPSALEAPDLLVTIGSRLFRRVSMRAGDHPVLAALIPGAAFDEVLSGMERSRRLRFAAVTLEQPAERQLQLAALLIEDLERVGVVVSAERAETIRNLLHGNASSGPEIVIEPVGDPGETALAFERIMDESDALLALPDPLLLNPNNTKWLLYMALNRNLPVIGYSAAATRAGALASVFSTPRQVGQQVARTLLDWSRDGRLPAARAIHPEDYRVETNPTVARRLGIRAPSAAELEAGLRHRKGAADK
jgi:ABC-type uncharacterized transport system substrate-binding protein